MISTEGRWASSGPICICGTEGKYHRVLWVIVQLSLLGSWLEWPASLMLENKERFFFQFSIDFVCVCFGVMHVQVNHVCRGVRVQMCAFAGEGQRRTPVSFHPSTMWFETGSLIGLLLNRPDWLNSENPHTEYHAS